VDHEANGEKSRKITKLGSMLFHRSVTGARVVDPSNTNQIGEYKFAGMKRIYVVFHLVKNCYSNVQKRFKLWTEFFLLELNEL